MTHALTFDIVDWLLRIAMASAIAYAIHVARRAHSEARHDAHLFLHWRLMELLPLPHLGDRVTLLAMLDDIAPGHELAVYTATEPPFVVARRHPLEPPGGPEARWIEVHRDALLAGQVVRDERCGTLVPLRLRDGRLSGALIIATRAAITLDDTTAATLRHVAGLIACSPTPTQHATTWRAPAPAR